MRESISSIQTGQSVQGSYVPEIDRAARFYVDKLVDTHGVVDPSSSVGQLVSRVTNNLREQVPGVKFEVIALAGGKASDTMALANGKIVLSARMLELLETEDELAAVLAHEITHISRAHLTELNNDLATRKGLSAHKRHMGLGRVLETEADIIPVIELLSNAGYNPLGMVKLFERLPESWSPEHGTPSDRRLNVLHLIPAIHLRNSDKPLIPISSQVKEEAQNLKTENNLAEKYQNDREVYLDRFKINHYDQEAFEQLLRHIALACKKNSAFLSEALNSLDSYLEAMNVEDKGVRAWTIAIWLAKEQGIDVFGEITKEGISKFQAGYSKINFRESSSLYDEVLDCNLDYLDQVSEALQYLPQVYGSNAIKTSSLIACLQKDLGIVAPDDQGGIHFSELAQRVEFLQQTLGLNPLSLDEWLNLCREFEGKLVFDDEPRANIISFLLDVSPEKGEFNLGSLAQLVEISPELCIEAIPIICNLLQIDSRDGDTAELMFKLPGSQLREAIDRLGHKKAFEILSRIVEDPGKEPIALCLVDLFCSESLRDSEDFLRYCQIFLSKSPKQFNTLLGDNAPYGVLSYSYFQSTNRSLSTCPVLPISESIEILAQSHFGGSRIKALQSSRDLFFDYRLVLEGLISQANSLTEVVKFFELHKVSALDLIQSYRVHFEADPLNCIEPLPESVFTEKINQLLPQAKSPKELLALGMLAPSVDLAYELRQQAVEMLKSEPHKEVLEALLFSDSSLVVPIFSDAAEVYFDRFCLTGFELNEATNSFLERVARDSRRNPEAFVMLDGVLEHKQFKPKAFLLAAINTQSDETPLAIVLKDIWWNELGEPFLNSIAKGTSLEPEYLEEWSKEGLSGLVFDATGIWLGKDKIPSIRDLMDQLYSSSPLTKQLIVRKLLLGENGILHNRQDTTELILNLISTRFELDQPLRETVSVIVRSIVEVATPEEIYFRTASLLADSLFIPPKTKCDRLEVFADDNIEHQILYTCNPDYESILADYELNQITPWLTDSDKVTLEKLYEERPKLREDLAYAVSGNTNELIDSLLRHGGLSLAKLIRCGFPDSEHTSAESSITERPKLSAADGIRLLLGSEGQFGARVSQIASQYAELPQILKHAFKGVFDQQRMQSKLVAYRLLASIAPGIIGLNDQMSRVIGGGSLGTVYKVESAGSVLAPKVAVPNPEVRIRESSDLWSRVLEHLEQSGFKPELMKLIRETLLNDVTTWILADVADLRFDELDPQFRGKWHGFQAAGVEIYIPKSIPTSELTTTVDPDYLKRMVKVDEYIEGRNLTEIIADPTFPPEEKKRLLTAYATFYISQLGENLVLSNPSPGNARVMKDGKLAILDRSYYLEFSDMEIEKLKISFSIRSPISNLAEKALEAILISPENSRLSESVRSAARKVLKENHPASLQEVSSVVAQIRATGVTIPLRYTLVFLGLNSIDSMFKDIGEPGIQVDRAVIMKQLLLGK